MHEIFISYRQEDSQDATGRIHDRLELYFGPNAVFRDIDSIRGGTRFPDRLDHAIASCKVVLVIIGPRWTTLRGEDGKPRIFGELDWVRLEIVKALARKIPVIPVTVTYADMPKETEVPPELIPLLQIIAVPVESRTYFGVGMRSLRAQIEELTDLRAGDYLTVLRDSRRLGMVGVSVGLLSTDPAVDETIRDAKQLLMVMNDGRGFLDSKQEDIRGRNEDATKSTRIVFLHPRSDYLHLLIKKNEKSHDGQIGDIRRGFEALCAKPDRASRIEIRGSYGVFPSAYLVSEHYAFVSPYLCAESGSLPIFRFMNNPDTRGLYARINEDAEKIFATAQMLSPADFSL